jgi:hypothetical protein
MPICQICGREIKASKGLIAHHGYRRPWEGVQTRSCEGARELPLDVSYAVLYAHVEMVKANVERLEAHILEPITSVTWKQEIRRGYDKETKYHEVTAANFEELKEQNLFRSHSISHFSVDDVLAQYPGLSRDHAEYSTLVGRELRSRRQSAKQMAEYHQFQAQRLADRIALDTQG